MKKLINIIAVLSLAALVSLPVQAIQTIKWDKTAIPLELIVGVEQMIHFEGPATVGLPATLANTGVFRHLFASNTAYWKAMVPFDSQRIKIRLDNTGEFLLFDVSAITQKKPPKTKEPLSIIVSHEEEKQTIIGVQKTEVEKITMFDLIRYAVQSDYSPERVIQSLTGVRKIKNKYARELSQLYNHADNINLDMTIRNSWSADKWYVTAITVSNRTAKDISVDPSLMQHTAKRSVNGVRNHFVATAMVNRKLGARGTKHESTIMYIVTQRPFTTVIDL